MKKPFILSIWILFLVIRVLNAQQSSDKKPDETAENNSLPAAEQNHPQHVPRFVLKLSSGIGLPQSDWLYGSWLSTNSAGTSKVYRNYCGSLGYLIHERFSLGAGYELFGADAQGVFSNYRRYPDRPFKMNFPINHGFFAFFNQSWQVSKKPLAVEVYFLAKGGPYQSFYRVTESGGTYSTAMPGGVYTLPELVKSGAAVSWGGEVAGGFSWLVKQNLALGIEAGYRVLKFNIYGISDSGYPIIADYTGPSMRTSVSIKF
jgi:hypothetical protein